MLLVLHGPALAPGCPTAVIADKIKHTFSKREQISSSAYHKRPALMQPVFRAYSTLVKRSFRMITLKQILSQICPGDWFMSLDLKDAYFYIQVAPHHRRFLRFTFEGVAYQYKVLPFGLSLAPRTFTRCMDAALSPLRQMGIRILNYLDDWLILAQSEAVSTSHKTLLLSHLDCLGLRVNFAKNILSPSQRVSFLGTVIDSVPMTATALSGASHDDTAPRGLLQGRDRPPAQGFPENAGPYGSSFASTSVGPDSHAGPSSSG